MGNSPYSADRDSQAGVGTSFGEETDAADMSDALHDDFASHAQAADQRPTAGNDQASQPTPSRYTYPFVRGPGGRLAD
jgi:hypothetical protein